MTILLIASLTMFTFLLIVLLLLIIKCLKKILDPNDRIFIVDNIKYCVILMIGSIQMSSRVYVDIRCDR